jgi:hypothetical protein
MKRSSQATHGLSSFFQKHLGQMIFSNKKTGPHEQAYPCRPTHFLFSKLAKYVGLIC